MKKQTQLFFLICFGMFWVVNSCLAGESDKEKADMAAEISEKTFFITEVARGHAAQKDYDAYFNKGGILAIKFSPTHSKSGKWKVDDKGILCITTNRNKKGKSISQTRCGMLVKSSKSAFRWYDDKGELRANFTLKGEGDRLP
jgi:hypothetical protein